MFLCLVVVGCASGPAMRTWRLDQVGSIGGQVPEVLGAPQPTNKNGRQAVCFDGKADGLFLPVNPIEGWPQFTIQILLLPEGDGPEEQRFFHIQDAQEHRVLIETRVDSNRQWSLDTFLRATDSAKLTLLDRAKTQPTDAWYWAALVYDGKTMRHFINGVQQLEGPVEFPPMGPGRISLGVRQNRIHWFKGCIAEARFTASALRPTSLQTP
jgi:Concanavalin A-like lectin/glucanases superfamily